MQFTLTEAGQTAVPYDPSKSIVLQSAFEARWGSTELPNDFADLTGFLSDGAVCGACASPLGANCGHPYLPKARFRQCSASERHEKLSHAGAAGSRSPKTQDNQRNFWLWSAPRTQGGGPVLVHSRGLRSVYMSLVFFALPANAQLKTELVNGYEAVANEALVKSSAGANAAVFAQALHANQIDNIQSVGSNGWQLLHSSA